MNKYLKMGVAAAIVMVVIVFAAFALQSSDPRVPRSKRNMQSMGLAMPDAGMGFQASDSAIMEKSMGADAPMAVSSREEDQSSQDLPAAEKKIRKDGNMDLKVDDVDKASENISSIAKDNGGEVFSSNFYQTNNNVKSGNIVVKVPVANFEKTFSQIKGIASLVVQESVSGDDMTEQYVDLTAQLKNKQAEEAQFSKILSTAQKINDVLAVTRELSRTRGNIEQLQTRIKYLEQQTDMSTISVNVSEDENITVIDSWRPLQVVKESFSMLAKSLQGFADFMIRFIIVVIPMIAVWIVLAWIAYVLGKKVYLKIKSRQQA